MYKKINIGVLSTANIAQKNVMPAIKGLDSRFNLIGIASRSSDKAKHCAETFTTTPYNDYKELLDDELLDAIYIPLPNALHYEWIKYAIKKNIHILVEKSLACSLGEVTELNQLALDHDVVLLENFQFRLHPQLKFVKDVIDSGEIGEVRQITSSFGFPPFTDENNIRYDKSLGGGALLDAGAYPIKISQELLGDDLFIGSASLSYQDDSSVDIWGSASLHSHKASVTSQISFGFDHFYQCKLEVWGSKGIICANRIFTAPPGFKADIEIQTESGTRIESIPEANHFSEMLCYFHQLIVGEESKKYEYEMNVTQARLISELLESCNAK
jgi:NDP-hexose-3-ketoreductase